MIDEAWTFAQQAVIGSCLIDDRAVGKIALKLSEDDFQDVYRSFFRVIRELYTTGGKVDAVTVLHKLGSDYKELTMQLMEITPTAANVDSYAKICMDKSRISRYRDIGEKLAGIESAAEAAEIIRDSNTISISAGMRSWSMADALHDFFSRYSRKVEYLPWYLQQLDGQISLEMGDFCILGGRPSSGKSAFALEAAVYWASRGYRVGFYSHETSREKLTNRIIAAAARVPLDGLKRGTLDDRSLQDVLKISTKLADIPLDLIACSGKTVAEMQANAIQKRHQIVIVDYLQIVSDGGRDEYEQVSNISKTLHVMCQSLGIYCLALSQLTRTKGARPSMEDLRSSGQLEQDADAIIFLHRQESRDDERELIIAKNKEGECRSTLLHFDGRIQHFSYLGKGSEPLKGFDYREAPAYHAPAKELEQLPMDTEVPFDGR